MMQLTLDKFDITKLTKDPKTGKFRSPRIIILGKTQCGKSQLMNNLLYYMRDIPGGVIISTTEKFNHFFRPIFPELFIHDEYQEYIIPKMIERQEILVDKKTNDERIYEENKAKGIITEYKPKDIRSILVMDDCLADKKSWINDTSIKKMFMQGRQYHITFILSLQFTMGITPDLRTNVDFLFIFKTESRDERMKLFKYYASNFGNFGTFEKVFLEVTKDYGCMVVDNLSTDLDITKKVFWFRADKDLKQFRFGCEKFWKYHKQKYDKFYDKKKQIDLTGISKKNAYFELKLK